MIQFIHVTKRIDQVNALCDVDLTIPDGEVVGILGENGAGKTTLLKSIAGLTEPTGGRVEIDGVDAMKPSGQISFITEEGSFFPFLNAKQHSEFFADFYDGWDEARFFQLLAYFKLPLDRKPARFSKGQQAKFEIAVGLSKGCRYLLLDEPFLGNDVFTRRDFLRLMSDSLLSGETILIATHLIDEIDNFIDRAVVLKDGAIVRDEQVDAIRESGQTLEDVLREVCGYEEGQLERAFPPDEKKR